MTSTLDRTLIMSSVAVNLVSVGTAIATPLADLPESLQAAAIGVAGATATFLAWKYVTVTQAALARKLLLATCALATALGVLIAWPGGPPIGNQGSESSSAKNPDHQKDEKDSAETQVAEAATRLKNGLQSPAPNSDIPSCITASGKGKIPDGYGLWVANLPESGGIADMTALNNVQRADQPDGEASWRTPEFGVGLGVSDAGTHYWIYLFLLPEPADSALTSLRLAKDGRSLTGPIKGATRVDKFRVTRDGTITCSYQKKT